jgi:hypothetical protein
MDPLVLKMRRLRLEDSLQDSEPLRLTPPLTGRWPRKQPLVTEMGESEPPTWGQIKKLMDMVMMVISSLELAGSPTATLLVALVIITIQMGVVQGDAHWTFMPNSPMVHSISWKSHPVSISTNDIVHVGGHSSGHLASQYSDYNFTGKVHLMGT